MNEIYEILRGLCRNASMEPERLAGELHAQFHYGRVEKIMKDGLHEHLMDFLEKLQLLHLELNSHFLVPADFDPMSRTTAHTDSE